MLDLDVGLSFSRDLRSRSSETVPFVDISKSMVVLVYGGQETEPELN